VKIAEILGDVYDWIEFSAELNEERIDGYKPVCVGQKTICFSYMETNKVGGGGQMARSNPLDAIRRTRKRR
jgi:hypothetical protein